MIKDLNVVPPGGGLSAPCPVSPDAGEPSASKYRGKGYFRAAREVMDMGYSQKAWAFLELLRMASHQTREVHNAYRDKLWIYPGETLVCVTALAKRLKSSRMSVHRWFKKWEKDGLLSVRHVKTDHNPANLVVRMTYYSTGGFPAPNGKGHVTPPTQVKVASINVLDEPEKNNVTPNESNVTGGVDKNVTGVNACKSVGGNDL